MRIHCHDFATLHARVKQMVRNNITCAIQFTIADCSHLRRWYRKISIRASAHYTLNQATTLRERLSVTLQVACDASSVATPIEVFARVG